MGIFDELKKLTQPYEDEDEDWELAEILQSGEENGISYEMCLYKRK